MNKIVRILMKRDNLTYNEAKDIYDSTRMMVLEAVHDDRYDEVEDILREELGLEMDYIDYIL